MPSCNVFPASFFSKDSTDSHGTQTNINKKACFVRAATDNGRPRIVVMILMFVLGGPCSTLILSVSSVADHQSCFSYSQVKLRAVM